MSLELGAEAPDFEANTSGGPMRGPRPQLRIVPQPDGSRSGADR
jgi:hypothetical protein